MMEKMELNSSEFEVWVKLDPDVCAHPGLKTIMIRQAIAWAEKQLAERRIAGYQVYEQRLNKAWEILQRIIDKAIHIKIIQAWPDLSNFEVQITPLDPWINLSFQAQRAEWSEVPFACLEAYVAAKLETKGLEFSFNPVFLKAAWKRAVWKIDLGQSESIKLQQTSKLPERVVKSKVILHEKMGVLEIQLGNPSEFDEAALQKLKSVCMKKLAKACLHRPMVEGRLFWTEVELAIETAQRGLPSLGADLPVKILAGMLMPVVLHSERMQQLKRYMGLYWKDKGGPVDWRKALSPRNLPDNRLVHPDEPLLVFNLRGQDSLSSVGSQRKLVVSTTLALPYFAFAAVRDYLVRLAEDVLDCHEVGGQRHDFGFHFFPMAKDEAQAKTPKAIDGDSHPWLPLIVREMTQFPNFFPDGAWLRDRLLLPVGPIELELMVQRLKEQGHLRFDPETKRWQTAEGHLFTPSQLSGEAIQAFYRSLFEASTQATERIPPLLRASRTLSIGLTENGFQELKARLEQATKELLAFERPEDLKQAVFTLSLFLVPTD